MTTNTQTTITNTEPVPLQLGQTYVPSGPIYTTAGPTNGTWFCDQFRRHEPLENVTKHHSVVLPPFDLRHGPLGRARWSPKSIARFTQGEQICPRDLWQRLVDYFARFFVADDDVLRLLAAFTMGTYVYSAVDTVPYLHFLGEPATGKTLVGELLEAVCFNARQSTSITAAAIYRFLNASTGTLIIDEQGAGDRKWGETTKAGYRKSGAVMVCEGGVPTLMRCFAPRVLMTNEPLADAALASRCILVTLQPTSRTGEKYTTAVAQSVAAPLRDDLHAFGLDFATRIHHAYRELPPIPGLSHRDEDLAALPVAVATVVDAADPSKPPVRPQLVEILRRLATKRREVQWVEAEGAALARAVTQFLADPGSARWKRVWHGEDWYLACGFTDFVNRSRELPHRLQAKEVGERLNRYGLITQRRVIDVPPADPLGRASRRVQRVAYQFDLPGAEARGGARERS